MSTTSSKKKKWLNTLKFLAAYLVAAWTFLQFVDWVLNRYNISPYWVDALLWLFIGIIPSLLIYLYHQERINKRILKRREKIIIPLNIILLCVVLYFGFGNSDLGATTKSIDYTDEKGKQQSALITKEEFREGFYIFNFKPKTTDSTKTWLETGITRLLTEDLLQNKNLSPIAIPVSEVSTADKAREASYFYDFYVDGEFEIIDSTYNITTYIRNSKNAEVIKQKTFNGNDVLDLIDDITVFVTSSMSSNEINAPKYLDLDVKEFTSNSLKALEYYMEGDYTNAIKEDSTFALAYLTYGKRNLTFNLSKFEERFIADKAFEYRAKLPLQKRGETLILKNLAYDEFENAEQLVKLQLEVDPSDDTYNRTLYNIYGRTKNLKAYTQRAYDAYDAKKNAANGYSLIEAGLIREDYDYILKQINAVSLLSPNDEYVFSLKLRPQLHQGDIEAAIKTQEKIKLLHPDLSNQTRVYDTAISYLKNRKPAKEDLKKFEGTYRSNHSEQIYTYWTQNYTILQYVSNQIIFVYLIAGDNVIVSGTPFQRTWKKEFFTNDSGEFFKIKMEQNDVKNTDISWQWKIDNTITKAEALLEAKQLDSAKTAYEEAIKTNPKHYYLKDALTHINYVKNTDSVTLNKQLKDVVGTYGPRTVWLDNGKLFYKRGNRARIELLPISENRYMNMSNLDDNFAFEYKDGNVINCYNYHYNVEYEIWVKNVEEGRSLFLKD